MLLLLSQLFAVLLNLQCDQIGRIQGGLILGDVDLVLKPLSLASKLLDKHGFVLTSELLDHLLEVEVNTLYVLIGQSLDLVFKGHRSRQHLPACPEPEGVDA